MVIILCDSTDALTILTVLMLFYKSVDTLWQFRKYPLAIPWTPFDNSVDILDDATDKLHITHAVNPRIL